MVTQVKKKMKIVKGFDKKVAIEFKKTMETAAEISGKSKIELLTLMGYQPNNAKQIFSNEDRNLPAYHVPEFCKQAGNNLIAEWIAEQLGMKLVPADQYISSKNERLKDENDTPSEIERLTKQNEIYKKKLRELALSANKTSMERQQESTDILTMLLDS